VKFTILGGSGFIGSHLAIALSKRGEAYERPERSDQSIFCKNLGHVIYCIGLTANFRERPFDTVRAHVLNLMNILENCTFDSFLYLSSTRLYLKGRQGDECADVCVNSNDPEDLYNLSKLMGESVCFASARPKVRVARLSNVFGQKAGSSDFISSLISDAVEKGEVILKSGAASEKDYVSVQDVVALLPKIAVSGQHRLYNVAAGKNVSHQCVLNEIQKITGCDVDISDEGESRVFPEISIQRIQDEFGFSPALLIPSLKDLIPQYEMRTTHDQN